MFKLRTPSNGLSYLFRWTSKARETAWTVSRSLVYTDLEKL
jgi:hypothetical protein